MSAIDNPAKAFAEAPLQSDQPPKDRVFYARHHTALKWVPYKPNSQEVKRGKMGQWKELRPYGIGWQNSEVTPEAGAWVEDPFNGGAYAAEATTLLNAAAPDLLASVIELLEPLERASAEMVTQGRALNEAGEAAFDRARAAIAKARGEA